MAIINGNNNDNILNGTINIDNLFGFDGNDELYGNSGNDILNGGEGNDFLSGGNGADTYLLNLTDGVDEIDNYDSDGKLDTANFTFASTELTAIFQDYNTGNLVLQYGTDSQLTIDSYFDGKAYRIDKFQFTDILWGLADIAQRHNGTSNSDNLTAFAAIANTINGLAGSDTLTGNTGADKLNGGKGNDSLYGNSANDILTGGTGNDYMEGNNGADTYVFGLADGADTINNYDTDGKIDTAKFNFAATEVTALFQAHDTNALVLQYGGSQLTVNDYFYDKNYRVDKFLFTDAIWSLADIAQRHNGTSSDDSLAAFDDIANTMNGLAGNDTLTGGTGTDTLNGDEGNDNLHGDTENDLLTGGAGNDYMEGNDGDDTYVINLTDGIDLINNYDADSGIDKVDFKFATSDVTALFEANYDLVFQYGNGGQLSVKSYFSDANSQVDKFLFSNAIWGIDDIAQRHNGTQDNDSLTAFDDIANTINGLDGDDTLNGGTGPDQLNGGGDNDKLYGNSENDTLKGGAGNDYMEGGDGDDTYVVSSADDWDTIQNYDSDNGIDSVVFTGLAAADITRVYQAHNSTDLVLQYADSRLTAINYFSDANSQIDRFQFTDGVWDLAAIAGRHNGTSYSETLYAFDGIANTINGLAGQDNLNGATGSDSLNGGSGQDTLYGNDGDDILNGGAGNDVLNGGNDADQFVFDTPLDNLENVDQIEDFFTSIDTLVLDNAIFTKFAAPGPIAAGNLVLAAKAKDANDFLIYNTSTGALAYDADGSGAGPAVQFATLIGSPELNATDILIA